MSRIALALIVAVTLFAGTLVIANAKVNADVDGERVKELSRYDLKEKIDGKDASATMVEVTIAPGKAGFPHHHPGTALVYVIEGQYELGVDDQPTKIYKAGETFQEPSGALHRVSRNPAATGNTR